MNHTGGEVRALSRRDEDLQLSRRLDWRFLLATPELGRVAYTGDERGSLLPALRAFSNRVVVLAVPADLRDEAGDGTFALAVARFPDQRELRRAAAGVAQGGELYCELRPALRRGGLAAGEEGARPVSLRSAVSMLSDMGFRLVRLTWHHPDFETCRRMVALNDRTAWRYLLTHDRASGFEVTARALAWLAARPSSASWIARLGFVSLVGRRRPLGII